jgi:lysine decarboxylase
VTISSLSTHRCRLSDDEIVLDPTRLTLYVGEAGIDGDTFKVKWLMDKYDIQVNKTSRNSVLFQVCPC